MKNIIFDFGNVLVRWEPEKIYAEHFGDEAKAWWFLRHVADNDWRLRIDAGESQELCINELKEQYPDYESAIELYRSRWKEMLTGEMPGMRELLTEITAGETPKFQVYGLTNWSMETFPQAREHFGILQMIDRYVVSGAEHLIKPDPRLFQVLLDRYGLRAEDCTFVDDNETNVAAACAMGMEGIVFKSADDLRRRLEMSLPLTDEERIQLERQGCTADDWSLLHMDPNESMKNIVRTHFHGPVELGAEVTVEDSHLSHCRIGARCVVRRVGWLHNYDIAEDCRLEGVGEMAFNEQGAWADVMNENGGRRIGLQPGMRVGDAYLWARYRDRQCLMQILDSWTTGRRGSVGAGSVVHNATAIVDGVIGNGCHVEHGVIAERFLLGENVKLEAGLRLNDSVVGDNSTLARGEVGCSLIFPAHEQHHNSSFLIAALVQGQSNVASGATLGSNHNGRTADGELSAGRGFWPGLCVSLKHNCRFASYTLLAKGDYPSELNITLPFALVNNNVHKNRLEVMPAYWWLYNMYALQRNRTKFAARDRRTQRLQHIVFNPLAPDTAEEIVVGRELLYMWTTEAYRENGGTEVVAHGMERGHRKTVILKPAEGYRAYEEMLIYYAMETLEGKWRPKSYDPDIPRERRWVNLGGQLVKHHDMEQMLNDIEAGILQSWDDLHKRLDSLWERYYDDRRRHAYAILCHLAQKKTLCEEDQNYFLHRYTEILQTVRDRITLSRQKDADNEFRQTTFWNMAEMKAVLQ